MCVYGAGGGGSSMGLNATQSMSELLRSQPLVFFCAVHVCVCVCVCVLLEGGLGLTAPQSMSEWPR